jgi:hypothetical protein
VPKSVLFVLIEVDPISGKESEQYPDAYPKEYLERVEKFSRNYIWRKITGDITIEFLEAAVERMFTADEVSSVVEPAKLEELKHRMVHLFLYANDSGRNKRRSVTDGELTIIVEATDDRLANNLR